MRMLYRPEKSLQKKVNFYGSEMESGDVACPERKTEQPEIGAIDESIDSQPVSR